MANAELRRRPNQVCLHVSDGSEGLIEIGWYLAEISAFGLRRQAQRSADLMDIRHCLGNFRLRNRQGGLPSIVLLPTYGLRRQQLLRACEIQLCQLERGVAFIERGDAGL